MQLSARRSRLREGVTLVLAALVLAMVIKSLFVQAFYIPSGSMENTLQVGDRVLVNKLVYRFRDVHRGEVIVFNVKDTGFDRGESEVTPATGIARVGHFVQRVLGLGAPGDTDYIKRVIAVPGDVVACCTDNLVTVNGEPVVEPYVHFTDSAQPQQPFEPHTVPNDSYWVMGDHRDSSSDSRFAEPPYVPRSAVIGRAFFVLYPPPRAKAIVVPEVFRRHAALAAAPPVLAALVVLPLGRVRRRRAPPE